MAPDKPPCPGSGNSLLIGDFFPFIFNCLCVILYIWIPVTRTEVVYEVSVEFQGRLKAAPPLTYDNTKFASLRVVILSTVRVAMYSDRVSYRSLPRALSVYLTFSPISFSSSYLCVLDASKNEHTRDHICLFQSVYFCLSTRSLA